MVRQSRIDPEKKPVSLFFKEGSAEKKSCILLFILLKFNSILTAIQPRIIEFTLDFVVKN